MRIMSACNMLHSDRASCLLSAHSIHSAMGVVGGGGRGIIFVSAINTTVVSWWGDGDGYVWQIEK